MKTFLLVILFCGLVACSPAGEDQDALQAKLYFSVAEDQLILTPETLESACFLEKTDGWFITVAFSEKGSEDLLALTTQNVGEILTLNYGKENLFSAQIMEEMGYRGYIGIVLGEIPKEKLFEIFNPVVSDFTMCQLKF